MKRAVLLMTLALLVGAADPALSHHILGIPHYSYDERYPQVPILTYRVEAGAYEVEMTGYPGKPQPGEQCFLNVYIRDPRSGASFDGVVTFRVRRDRMIGSDPVIYGPVEGRLDEAVYKFYPRFDAEADYIASIHYETEDAPWTIELPIVVGEPGSPGVLLGAIAAGVVVFLLLIRALRIKLRRKARFAPAGTAPWGPIEAGPAGRRTAS